MSNLISTAPAPSPATVSETPDDDLIATSPPLHIQVLYFISIYTFRCVVNTSEFLARQFKATPPSQFKPILKTYPVRPMLENRIFIPPVPASYSDNGDEQVETEAGVVVKYPVYFTVHGGGWAASSPIADDEFCSLFCRMHNIIVVSLDYRKAPTFKFPEPVMDVAHQVSAILEDDSLPIDKAKVAIGGFSAGGNLAFAACQTEGLKGRFKAVVGLFPVLDSSERKHVKMGRRPKGKEVPIDGVGLSAYFLDWGYVPRGQDRRDPLLSPRYAARGDLPKAVFLMGCEWDMLCHEAEATADGLVVEGEERKVVEGEGWYGWVQGKVRWEKFLRKPHAFTHVAEWSKSKEDERRKLVDGFYERMGKWLKEEAWSL